MVLLALLLLLATAGIVRTVLVVRDDRPRTPPRSHHVDQRFTPPATWSR